MSTTSLIDLLPAAARLAPETPEQVALALDEALRTARKVVVFSTGHGIPPIGDTSERMLLDLSAFNQVEIDPVRKVARIGGAVQWHQLVAAAGRHGLTAPFGSASSVGVTGYMMGGGIGFMSRHLGLGCSAIRAATLVTPEGHIRRIDAGSDPDLFWALRGGGGGFGVITELEIDLTPVPQMAGGVLGWGIEEAGQVLERWSEWTADAPDDVTTAVRLVHPPEGPALTVVVVTAPREAEDLAGLIAPLTDLKPVLNTVRNTSPESFMAEYTDPEIDPDTPPDAYEHVMLDRLPAEACQAAAEFAQPLTGCGAMMIELRHLGGALGRPSSRGGALDRIDGEFSLFMIGPQDGAVAMAHAGDVLSDFGRGRTYFNFMTERTGRQTAYPPETIERLADLYEAVDPEGLLDHPHPISRIASEISVEAVGGPVPV
ncbi:MAG: FAD-dependent oxidoreductase [Actinomycetota bacterium]|jgi:FAD/FMN-containing dehydrogenase|nr:FAD-dependent oxidoreductase [Actinomycetota bacterium]